MEDEEGPDEPCACAPLEPNEAPMAASLFCGMLNPRVRMTHLMCPAGVRKFSFTSVPWRRV